MPRSIAASLSWQSSFIGMNQALRLHPLPFDVNDWELALISVPMRGVVGHMRHSSRVLQCCYPERSSCDHEFGCRYPYNTHLQHFDFLFVMWKNLRVFMNLNSAGKLQEKLLNWTCQAFFLFNQSDYLNQTVSWYAYWSVLYECIEHADDTDVRFWN